MTRPQSYKSYIFKFYRIVTRLKFSIIISLLSQNTFSSLEELRTCKQRIIPLKYFLVVVKVEVAISGVVVVAANVVLIVVVIKKVGL